MSPSQSIAHYRITSKLGEGGMGAVYRATDTKLNREVAIKVLPDSFAEDPERMVRFAREAQVLASLNHPNIASIYGVEERALVMELVEGQTLTGPLSMEEALPIIQQLIDALEYAHDRGIVHRDLKPANIKITPEGRVKVLDFGLAKALSIDVAPGNPAASPTMTMRATLAGTILGTAAYMAPEQARGHNVDRRADIWAFGVVVYELLAGQTLFQGPTVSDTLAAVLRQDPDLEAAPAKVRPLLRHCLVRDPRQRLSHISGARILLDQSPDVAPAVAVRTSRYPWIAAAALAVALAAVSFLHFRESPPEARVTRFSIVPPESVAFGYLAISPDGRLLAYTATDSSGKVQLWVRPLDLLAARVLPGTEGARDLFWSPDSRFIGFFADNRVKKVDVAGAPPQIVCAAPNPRGGAWNRDGSILFANGTTGIAMVPAAGGEPKSVTTPDAAAHELVHRWPAPLPDGRHFLFNVYSSEADRTGVYVGSLNSQDRTRLLPDETNAIYAADSAGNGFLLFSRAGNMMAQRFDAATRRLSGEPVPLADQVEGANQVNVARFSASGNGVLAYQQTGSDSNRLTWFDRAGKRLGTIGDRGLSSTPRFAPDYKRLAASQQVGGMGGELYIIEIVRDIASRFSFNKGINVFPAWSPDGSRLYYSSNRDGQMDLMQKPSNGAGQEELVLHSNIPKYPTDVSPDGRFLLFSSIDNKTGNDLWVLPLDVNAGTERKPIPLLQSPAAEQSGIFSPDGKWFAYTSDESGRPEIYLRPFAAPGSSAPVAGQWQVSKDGGQFPRWRRDGKELFYYSGVGKITAVAIQAGASVQIGVPQPLFTANLTTLLRFDVTADGQRFVLSAPAEAGTLPPATVVLNWTTGLK